MTSIESIPILNILDCSSADLTKQDIRDPVGRRICRRAQDAAPGRSPPRQSGRGKVPAPGANQVEIQGITKETFSGFANGNSCLVAFSPATHMQPLKQTA